jgi:hypothetical protein
MPATRRTSAASYKPYEPRSLDIHMLQARILDYIQQITDFTYQDEVEMTPVSIVHYVVLRKIEEMEIQTVMKRNEEGRRSFSSVFFHRTFSYFYKFLLVNF